MAVDSGDVIDDRGEKNDEIGLGSIHDAFTDDAEVKKIIVEMKAEHHDERFLEMCDQRFGAIINKYREQPHLLDPYLDGLLTELLNTAISPETESALMHQCFKFLHKITRARGYKVIVRHLPHEVADLEPVLALLTQQNPHDMATWETRYMLLLWLSIIVMIPFHMARLDSNIQSKNGGKKPIMTRILEIGKLYLGMQDTPQDAAAFLLSRFVTRPDVKELHLQTFIHWCLDSISKFDGCTVTRCGELATLALLFKHGKREDMLSYAGNVLQCLLDRDFKSCPNTNLRKLSIKLTQRLGMTFLKPRVALWRYQRGSRCLEANLASANEEAGDTLANVNYKNSETSHEDEEDFDVPEEVESVIQELLTGLKDKETIIRWSAAKGIGRVTSRLPKELGDEVVGSVLELFTFQETDCAWHGACLALAELGRRGLLLPERLPDVVPVIVKALIYDQQKGSFSVGDHIRDAACYVCWAFARAYDPVEMKPYVNKIANALLITTIFDREIHCRRAASAAFQENVGRQGTFPHGIDIVTTADYFAVGNRNTAFLNISVYIAQFPEYTISLINHLVEYKINHWDSSVRELASLALHNLTPKAPQYMISEVLPRLLSMTTGSDLNTRHGSIFSVAEVIHSLFIVHGSHITLREKLGEAMIQKVKDVVPILQERKLFRGLGGELMRIAVCKLIEKTSSSKMPFHSDNIIEIWQNLIDDCLRHGEIKIVTPAIAALTSFCNEYYCDANGKALNQQQEWLLNNYLQELQSTSENTRMGFCMALGVLPGFLLAGKLNLIIPSLISCTIITEKDTTWAKARREAVNALSSICSTVGVSLEGTDDDVITPRHATRILECFLQGLQDYTIDSCGDIGSYVRKAAMCGLESVVTLVIQCDQHLISPDICQKIMCGIAHQAVEKIENLRLCAANTFLKLLHSDPGMLYIPHKDELLHLFPQSTADDLEWRNPNETLSKFIELISLPTYVYQMMLGLSVTAGGLSEHLVRNIMASLLQYFNSLGNNRDAMLRIVCKTLAQIFNDYGGVTRVTLPLMKTIDQLLSSGNFDEILQDPEATFAIQLFDLVKKELNKCTDLNKIINGITVLCELIQCPSVCRNKVLAYLCIMLCHRYPRIRKEAASKLFTALVSYEDVIPSSSVDDVMTLLSETDWCANVEDLRPVRNNLCDLLKIPKPKLAVK